MDLFRLEGSFLTVVLCAGVIWDFASQAWRSKIKVKGHTWYLGVYRLEVDAAVAYDAASWFIQGNKAVVNFPDTNYDVVDVPRPPPKWLIEHILEQVDSLVSNWTDACLPQASAGKRTLSPSFRRWYEKELAKQGQQS